MDEAQVAYQFAELGRVDLGGGGTIAYIMAYQMTFKRYELKYLLNKKEMCIRDRL